MIDMRAPIFGQKPQITRNIAPIEIANLLTTFVKMCIRDSYEGVKNIRQKPECPVYLLFEEPEKYVAKDGAESFEELYHRTGEFIEQVLRPQLEAGKNVLVVGHGAMNCSIVNQFRGTPIKDFWKDMQGNCELLRVE